MRAGEVTIEKSDGVVHVKIENFMYHLPKYPKNNQQKE